MGKAELGTENESKGMSLIQMVAWTKEQLYPTSPKGSVVVVPLQLARPRYRGGRTYTMQ